MARQYHGEATRVQSECVACTGAARNLRSERRKWRPVRYAPGGMLSSTSRSRSFGAWLALLAIAGARSSGAASAGGPITPTGFSDVSVIGGLDYPTSLAFLPDGRLFFVEQASAQLRLLVQGSLAATDPVITVPNVTSPSGTEQGLLGVAVDPQFPARPFVYVVYDRADSSFLRISRFTLGGDLLNSGNGALTIDPGTRYDLLSNVPDNASNHNGGTLRFQSDGTLLASFGEDADECAAQDLTQLKGKILRLAVDALPPGPGRAFRSQLVPQSPHAPNPFAADPDTNAQLVFLYGLRNPFRFHADPPTVAAPAGQLLIADVGQSRFEELDVMVEGDNGGWPLFEGNASWHVCSGVSGITWRAPIYVFDRTGGPAAAVISGGIYHRNGVSTAFPAAYEGDAFVSDYYRGYLRRLKRSGATWSLAPETGQANANDWGAGYEQVADWMTGPDGALWYCRQADGSFANGTGSIHRIAYVLLPDTVAPTVQLLAPVGGEGWDGLSTHSLQWSATDDRGVTGIDLEYSTNGGGSYAAIQSGLANSGSYLWSTPNLASTQVRIRVTAHDAAGHATSASSANFTLVAVTPPTALTFSSFPQPADVTTTLRWTLPNNAQIEVLLHDSRGRIVRHLVRPESQGPGSREAIWDGNDDDGRRAPAGLYFATLRLNGAKRTTRIVLLR